MGNRVGIDVGRSVDVGIIKVGVDKDSVGGLSLIRLEDEAASFVLIDPTSTCSGVLITLTDLGIVNVAGGKLAVATAGV